MTTTQAIAYLKRITYKPNFTFRFVSEGPIVKMYIAAAFPDSDDPERMTSANMEASFHIYHMQKTEYILDWFWDHLQGFECHEMHEWFKVDGVKRWNPHQVSLSPH